MSFLVGDAKLLSKVSDIEECGVLEGDLNKLWEWSLKWKMELYIKSVV